MENGPFEDVVPMKHVDIHCYVSLPKGTWNMFFVDSFLNIS